MKEKKNNKMKYNVLYSLTQASYWMMYCTALSFPSVYLLGRGYSNTEIGVILAIGNLLSIISQPLLGQFADKTKKISLAQILMMLYFALALCFGLLVIIPDRGLPLSIAYALLIMLAISAQPLTNALSDRMSSENVKVDFGIGRAFGSFAYAIISLIIGKVIVSSGIVIVPAVGFVISMVALTLYIVIALTANTMSHSVLADNRQEVSQNHTNFVSKYPWFIAIVVCISLGYTSHAFMNNYYFQIVENIGGDSASLGRVLSLNAVFELPAMFLFSWLEKKIGLKPLLYFSIVMFFVKGLFTMLAPNVTVLLFGAIAQGLSFAVMIPATVSLANRCMEEADRVRGQATITTLFSVIFLATSLTGGFIIDHAGVIVMQLIGVISAAAGSILAIPVIKKLKFRDEH